MKFSKTLFFINHRLITYFTGGIHTGGAVPGSLICGPLMAEAGQRRAILLVTPFVMVSWLVVSVTASIPLLLAARYDIEITSSKYFCA